MYFRCVLSQGMFLMTWCDLDCYMMLVFCFVGFRTGKENNLSDNSTIKTPRKKLPIAHTKFSKSLESQKLQVHTE